MAKGGSRYGAGRPGWHLKIEQCHRLDVRELAQRRLMIPGAWTTWRWTNTYTGEKTGSIAIHGEDGRIVLDYRANDEPVKFPILLTHTQCHFGGSRPWFICPRCGRRCGIIAYGGRGWACRVCLNLAYSSEAEDAMGRLWRRQRKLEARLGEDWEKPKGMHQKTHGRICDQLNDIERRKDEALKVELARLFGKGW